jgi:predicted nucleic acid-binding Zn ribbon protein
LANVLDAVMAGLGGPTVEAIVVVHERWAEVVGAEVAPHAKPLGISGGRLQIGVASPGWASHLRWSEGEILARLAELIGPDQVIAVTVRTTRN